VREALLKQFQNVGQLKSYMKRHKGDPDAQEDKLMT
jgi:hypothetical protein